MGGGPGPWYTLLRPITDKFADLCGVERRKYLTRFDFKNHCCDEDGRVLYKTSDKLYNLDTSHCFCVDPNLLTLKEVQYNDRGRQEYCALYEGKIKMIAPIPISSMMITEYMIYQ